MPLELVTLNLKIPRSTEVTPEAAQTFLSALTQINAVSFWEKLTGTIPQPLALEIALVNQQIKFQITCDKDIAPFIETQLQSNYPLVIIERTPDILSQPEFFKLNISDLQIASLILKKEVIIQLLLLNPLMR